MATAKPLIAQSQRWEGQTVNAGAVLGRVQLLGQGAAAPEVFVDLGNVVSSIVRNSAGNYSVRLNYRGNSDPDIGGGYPLVGAWCQLISDGVSVAGYTVSVVPVSETTVSGVTTQILQINVYDTTDAAADLAADTGLHLLVWFDGQVI